MYNKFTHLKDQKTSLSYLGVISDSITDKFISLGEYYLANSSQLGKLKNKVSFLIAECFQNTVRHGDRELSGANHKDFFQINVWDDGVVLSSCNLVQGNYVAELQKKFEFVNSLGSDGLKKLHDEVMRNEGFSSKGGAGLGLIDMARKSGLPLRFNFNSIENNLAQFFLALETAGKKETPVESKISADMQKELAFYNDLVQQKVMLLYKGDFSKEVTLPLIEMLDHNLVDSKNISSKDAKTIITIIEVLQNISKHAKAIDGVKPGIFSISDLGGSLAIEGGNFVEEHEVPAFKAAIETIKDLSLEETISLYKQRLANPEITPEGNSGLGLIEIARNSSMQFTYSFTQTPDRQTFFSIKIIM
ncbi:MAG TPA: SiaB family protein kinase [Bacteroidia bacterium]|nr:SiaB family protein kinase [Bacteroidia bacterium]